MGLLRYGATVGKIGGQLKPSMGQLGWWGCGDEGLFGTFDRAVGSVGGSWGFWWGNM